MSHASPTHELEEHVGEVALGLRAGSLAELFAEAARALAELMTDETERGKHAGDRPEHIEVQSPDVTALLVDWLNELIFLSETKRSVYPDVTITRISNREIVAEARGVTEPALKTAVKAATFHEARVTADDSGYRAHVVLDVRAVPR